MEEKTVPAHLKLLSTSPAISWRGDIGHYPKPKESFFVPRFTFKISFSRNSLNVAALNVSFSNVINCLFLPAAPKILILYRSTGDFPAKNHARTIRERLRHRKSDVRSGRYAGDADPRACAGV
ncbi:MAG: hypothetical protein LBL42_01725 [Tannerella sp.]|nr:hypothetical protein [Tannerella sp.]